MKNFFGLAVVTSALLLAGCGGGSPAADANTKAASTAVQVNLGDDPADRLLAANMAIDSLAFTNASGASVPVLSATVNMEMMQSMGTVRPLSLTNMPQGTYSGATMTFAAATVTYMDAASGQVMQRTVPGPMTAKVNFDQSLVVGSAPMVVNLDMDMNRSVTIDGNGNVSMMPALTAAWRTAVPGSHDPEDGGINHMTGMVGNVSGASLHMTMLQGFSDLTLMTHAGTEFAGVSGMGAMGAGMLVAVDASLQADGSWLASRVQSVMPVGGSMVMGVVTAITGNPPTQIVLAARDGTGQGMMSSNLAGTTTVDLGSATSFEIESHDVDLSNLPFTPRFDAASLSKGQSVAAFSGGRMTQGGGMGGMMGGGTIAASAVQLVPQGLRGTVSAYAANGAQASFTLTVPADSAFAVLSGSRSLTVYQQPGTRLGGVQSIANGAAVTVRGLLFVDAGAFKLVSARIVGA